MQPVQRGISVFNSLLFDDVEVLPKKEHKGRSPELLEARDRLLLHRFYFKTKLQRKQYLDVLKELESEIFISRVQIQKIVQANSDQILHIKHNQPTISWLKQQWPFFTWN